MNLLFGEQKKKYEEHRFKINSGSELTVGETGEIIIHFVNDKFDKVEFPFSGMYSRNAWRILAAIEAKITEIEDMKRVYI